MIIRKILIFCFSFLGLSAMAQELNCQVDVNTQKLQNVSTQTFETLKESITEYMNSTKFSEAQLAPNEKIDCRMLLTVSEYTDNIVKGTLQVQSSRPVYNSNYTTTLINFQDAKIDFSYNEGEQLNFTQNGMESQLTQLLNFYAYLILAMDFDSFSPRGGEPFWERLKAIVQDAQSSGEVGWKAFDDNKNRSAILEGFTSPQTEQIRDFTYNYHRRGLDEMAQSADKGRSNITEAIDVLKTIYDAQPMSVVLSMTRDAKLDELVNVYSKAQQTERERVYEALYPLWPTENKRLNAIKNGAQK